jgi:Family of unknown function (DUF5691)
VVDPEIAWEELAAAALLGTERRPFTPPSVPGPLAALFTGLSGREPEKALLGTAATLSLFRRAGRRPIKAESTPLEPAEADDRPFCSAIANGHLALILSGIHAEILPEWLGVLHEAGKRPPDETLPDLLELGRSKADLRPKIIAAVGPLGAWLARQNPDWTYASGASVEARALDDATIEILWESGTTEERTTLLHRLRQSDPGKSRSLVASTWTTDGPDVRAKFLEAFEIGLTPDDEPFLETALDDRRKEVRSAASDLLKRLPGSALVARMIARVAPLLKVVETNPGEIAIDATMPEACDKAMIRDGIEVRLFRPGIGEKANWLYLMVGRIPPSHWSRTWSWSPVELARAAVRSQWNDALYPALMEAAVLHNDSDWIDALLPHRRLAGKSFNIFAHFPSIRESTVLSLIRAEDADVRIRFQGEPLTEEQMNLLHRTPGPWGSELSRLILERLPRNLADGNHIHYALTGFLQAAARCLPTAGVLAAPLHRTVADADVQGYLLVQVDRHLEEFHALIQFRHEMTQELRR